jgi:ADP-heptose:LPS heptosyltransferase
MNLKSNLYNYQFKLRQRLIGKYYEYRKSSNLEINPESFRPGKVLFVLAGLLGDSVMSSPTISDSRKLWPDSRITLLGKKHNCELLADCPSIDEFYECSADPLSLRKSNEIGNLQKWLESQNFDLAVILLGDQFAHLLAKAKIPVRVGVRGTLLESCLTNLYDIGSPRTWGTKERMNALRCLGFQVGESLPRLWVENEARKSASRKLREAGLKSNESYAVFHPFGSTLRQWWDLENAVPLANHLREKYNLKIVLVGKSYNLNGTEVVPRVREEFESVIVNTTGKLELPELLAVIDNSKLVITTDSGPFHIAGALQKPTVGLFRARRPEHARSYPTARVILGVNEACQKNCRWDHCDSNPCRQLSNISLEHVLDEIGLVN